MIYSFRILKEFLYDVHDTLSTKPLDHRKATFLLIAHKSFAVERHKFKLKFWCTYIYINKPVVFKISKITAFFVQIVVADSGNF